MILQLDAKINKSLVIYKIILEIGFKGNLTKFNSDFVSWLIFVLTFPFSKNILSVKK